MKDQELLGLVRNHQPMTVAQEIELILKLSLPSMLAQLSTILMFYIDASMVGSLGAEASAAVGIVTSSLWVFGGLNAAVAMGFSVQVAHAIGANDNAGARQIVRQAYPCALLVSLCLGALGVLISGPLPQWLGGAPEICPDGSAYFLIFALICLVRQILSGFVKMSTFPDSSGYIEILCSFRFTLINLKFAPCVVHLTFSENSCQSDPFRET